MGFGNSIEEATYSESDFVPVMRANDENLTVPLTGFTPGNIILIAYSMAGHDAISSGPLGLGFFVKAAVDGVLARSLAKDPSKRTPDVTTFAKDLTDALTLKGASPPPRSASRSSSTGGATRQGRSTASSTGTSTPGSIGCSFASSRKKRTCTFTS
jgi:hypothetical protein